MDHHKYYFSIGCIFKNESHIIREWIEHYLLHGVDHIYMINDNSTDNFIQLVQPYIDNGYVTIYNCNESKCWMGMQTAKYNYYFKDVYKLSKWFGIFDLDEFLYSPREVDLKKVMNKYDNETQLMIDWVHFGSSGHIEQPENVVRSFLYRGEYGSEHNGPNGRYNSHKSIIKTDKPVVFGLHVHQYDGSTIGRNVSFTEDPENPDFLVNHYAIQSLNFWINVKMTRGDVNYYYDAMGWNRNRTLFDEMDVNDILDSRLMQQNCREVNLRNNITVASKDNKIPIPKLPWNIYWINLDRRPDRKQHTEDILINNKENSFRIQAVDYENDFSPFNVIQHPRLNGGEHGCTCSHIKAMHYYLTTTTDTFCFIVEDDLSNDYSQYWQEHHYDILRNGEHDILQLQTTSHLYEKIENKMNPIVKWGSGTTIYKIKRSVAEIIVKNHFKHETQTINLSNHEYPVADSLIYNSGKTYLLPMFSYLNVNDSDTNRDANKNMNDYWKSYYFKHKQKYLNFWRKTTIFQKNDYSKLYENYFYTGSCRYTRLFKNFFPGRLHTTREVLFFLENYDNMQLYEDANLNFIFGGSVDNDGEKYRLSNFINGIKTYNGIAFSSIDESIEKSSIDTFIMEISSRKLFYDNDKPMSEAYVRLKNKNTSNLILKKLTENEIDGDISTIQQILKTRFNIHKLAIVSHFNINEPNNIIYKKRQKLIDELTRVCEKHNITFINPVNALNKYNIVETDIKQFLENNIITIEQYTQILHILNTKDYSMNNFMSDYVHYNGVGFSMHYFMNYILFQYLENYVS